MATSPLGFNGEVGSDLNCGIVHFERHTLHVTRTPLFVCLKPMPWCAVIGQRTTMPAGEPMLKEVKRTWSFASGLAESGTGCGTLSTKKVVKRLLS